MPEPAGAGPEYDALVLQGGASHALFTLGFLQAAAPALRAVSQIAAVSSGAAVACAHLLGLHEEALERFLFHVRGSRGNFTLRRLLRGQRPTPHHALYHAVLAELLTPSRFAALKQQPIRLRILIALSSGRSRLVAGVLAAQAVVRSQPPPGLSAYVSEAQSCARVEELVQALLASAAVPLLAPLPRLQGRVAVDGSSISPIPLCALQDARRPLVVLTQPRPLRPLPDRIERIAPDQMPALSPWDFSDEPGWRRLYAHGLVVGARFAATPPRPPH